MPRRGLLGSTESMRARERAGVYSRPSLASGFVCSPALTATLHLPSRGSGLVDLLIARRGRLRAYLNRGVHLIELKVVYLPVELGEVYNVLGVAGVGYSLNACALAGVVARLGDVKGLVYVPALSLLLDVLVQRPIEVEALEVFVVIKEEAVKVVLDEEAVEEEAVEEELLLAIVPAIVPAVVSVIR